MTTIARTSTVREATFGVLRAGGMTTIFGNAGIPDATPRWRPTGNRHAAANRRPAAQRVVLRLVRREARTGD